MNFTISIIGRPNVGKSTLFNRLTKTKNALISIEPNSTRDRNDGYLKLENYKILIIDTAGINKFFYQDDTIEKKIFEQTNIAIEKSNLVFFLLNGQEGITYHDQEILGYLRKKKKYIILIINKIKNVKDKKLLIHEYHILGIKDIFLISAISGEGINTIIEKFLKNWLKKNVICFDKNLLNCKESSTHFKLKISILGKPNVGKSTLLNTLLNQNRVITYDSPGTTRDNIAVSLHFSGKKYKIIDTAGIKKKNKIKENIQNIAYFKTIKSIKESHISILLIDFHQGISKQDLLILNLIIKFGKSFFIIINKSEHISLQEKNDIQSLLMKKNNLIKYIKIFFISALHKIGTNKILFLIDKIYQNSHKTIKSSELNQILKNAICKNPPMLIKGKKIKLKYAHPGGYNPPTIIIHGNQSSTAIPKNYKSYLLNFFQQSLQIKYTAIKIIFKKNKNPYI